MKAGLFRARNARSSTSIRWAEVAFLAASVRTFCSSLMDELRYLITSASDPLFCSAPSIALRFLVSPLTSMPASILATRLIAWVTASRLWLRKWPPSSWSARSRC